MAPELYDSIKKFYKEKGDSDKESKRIAAATFNKMRHKSKKLAKMKPVVGKNYDE